MLRWIRIVVWFVMLKTVFNLDTTVYSLKSNGKRHSTLKVWYRVWIVVWFMWQQSTQKECLEAEQVFIHGHKRAIRKKRRVNGRKWLTGEREFPLNHECRCWIRGATPSESSYPSLLRMFLGFLDNETSRLLFFDFLVSRVLKWPGPRPEVDSCLVFGLSVAVEIPKVS